MDARSSAEIKYRRRMTVPGYRDALVCQLNFGDVLREAIADFAQWDNSHNRDCS